MFKKVPIKEEEELLTSSNKIYLIYNTLYQNLFKFYLKLENLNLTPIEVKIVKKQLSKPLKRKKSILSLQKSFITKSTKQNFNTDITIDDIKTKVINNETKLAEQIDKGSTLSIKQRQ